MKGFFSRENKFSILAIALLLVLFCHRPLFTSLDRVLAAFDMGHMQYFWAYFKEECYLNGILPLEFAMNLSIVLHLLMAGIFTYLYCREIKLSPNASLLGSIVFMLHGFFANQLTLGHIDIVRTACYLPAVFYFVERWLIRNDWKSYLWGSLALALQIWKIKIMNHLGLELFSTRPSAVSRLFNTRLAVSFDPATQTFRAVESRHWTPRAYLVSNYQLVETEADSLSIVSEKGFDPLELVVLEKPPAIPPGSADSGSRVLSTRTSINEIEVSYRAMTPKILVLSEQYYPG